MMTINRLCKSKINDLNIIMKTKKEKEHGCCNIIIIIHDLKFFFIDRYGFHLFNYNNNKLYLALAPLYI